MDIKEVLKYWTAERFKALQRKVTSAANTIEKDMLNRQSKQLFSEKEQETLHEALMIMRGLKRKVELAKEQKEREERAFRQHVDKCAKLRGQLLKKYTPTPTDEKGCWEVFSWRLALSVVDGDRFPSLRRLPDLVHVGDMLDRLEAVRDRKADWNWTPSLTWLCNTWLDGDVIRELDERLWPYSEMPEEALISEFSDYVNTDIKKMIESPARPDVKKAIELFSEIVAISSAENVTRLSERKS